MELTLKIELSDDVGYALMRIARAIEGLERPCMLSGMLDQKVQEAAAEPEEKKESKKPSKRRPYREGGKTREQLRIEKANEEGEFYYSTIVEELEKGSRSSAQLQSILDIELRIAMLKIRHWHTRNKTRNRVCRSGNGPAKTYFLSGKRESDDKEEDPPKGKIRRLVIKDEPTKQEEKPAGAKPMQASEITPGVVANFPWEKVRHMLGSKEWDSDTKVDRPYVCLWNRSGSSLWVPLTTSGNGVYDVLPEEKSNGWHGWMSKTSSIFDDLRFVVIRNNTIKYLTEDEITLPKLRPCVDKKVVKDIRKILTKTWGNMPEVAIQKIKRMIA